MSRNELTISGLRRILREAAGESAAADLDSDILDTDFADLGYDSIALLETGARIERECGITLEDDTCTSAGTPRVLLRAVNERLAGVR